MSTKLKDLPEAQRKIAQSIIDERIGKITAKATAETKRLGDRVVELTTELETTRKNANTTVVVPGSHPAMLLETPEQVDQYADRLDQNEDLLEGLKDTGIESDPENGTPGYTAEQV